MNSVNKNKIISHQVILFIFIVIYLSLVVGYYESYDYKNFPDAIAHLSYINDVIQTGFPNYDDGEILYSGKYNYLNHPPLYYLVVGVISKTLIYYSTPMVVASLINIVNGLGVLYLVYKILVYLRCSKWALFLGLSIFLLTPMYLELSVAVNNDLLSVFGSTLALWALVIFNDCVENNKRALQILFVGGAIAALTKATATLAIVSFLLFHLIINFRIWLKTLRSMTFVNWCFPVFVTALLVGYYLFNIFIHGEFFPVPQGNPADYFHVLHPETPRWGIAENISRFFIGNLFSFTKPYGHQLFDDISLRYDILIFTLVILTIVVLFGAIKEIKNKKTDSVSLWMWPGYCLFIVVYFIVLRKMHLSTGYPGALQARYFYSYLPVFAIGIALSLDSFKVKALRRVLIAIVLVNISLAFYPSWYRVIANDFYTNMSEQVNATGRFGELISGRKFEQSFIAKGENLDEIHLLLSTFSRANNTTLTIKIVTPEGIPLFDKSLNTMMLYDNAWFKVNANISNLSIGGSYLLQLTTPDAYNGNAISWWANVKQPENPYYENTKYGPIDYHTYDTGEAIVDGTPESGADFVFRLNFR